MKYLFCFLLLLPVSAWGHDDDDDEEFERTQDMLQGLIDSAQDSERDFELQQLREEQEEAAEETQRLLREQNDELEELNRHLRQRR